MKIFTFIILSFLVSSTLSAQDKGNILIGGTLRFSKSNYESPSDADKETNVGINPSIGKFYKNNRLAGVNIHYSRSSHKDKDRNQSSYGGGLFLRQYKSLGKSFLLFAEEGIQGSISKYTNHYGGYPEIERVKTYSGRLYFYPGLAYSLNKKLQLEISLPQLVSIGYSNTTRKFENTLPTLKSKNNSFDLTTGFGGNVLGNLSFGVKWMING